MTKWQPARVYQMLCNSCYSISLDSFGSEIQPNEAVVTHQKRLDLQNSLLELKVSAAAGCDLCVFFFAELSNDYGAHGLCWELLDPEVGSSALSTQQSALGEAVRLWLDVSPGSQTLMLWTNLEWLPFDLVQQRECLARRLFYSVDPEHTQFQKAPLCDSPASDPCFALARRWIAECDLSHPQCQRNRNDDSFVPSRLLEVLLDASKESLKLVHTKHISKPDRRYLALSHCWGQGINPDAKTTKDTLAKHLEGLVYDILPQTFKDAITIAKKLFVPYLWIDSLRIIQDSTEDWQSESAMMGMIYGNSYCTIAAAGVKDGNGGCFIKRDPRWSRVVTLPRTAQETSDIKSVSIFQMSRARQNILTLTLLLNEHGLFRRGNCLLAFYITTKPAYLGNAVLRVLLSRSPNTSIIGGPDILT